MKNAHSFTVERKKEKQWFTIQKSEFFCGQIENITVF